MEFNRRSFFKKAALLTTVPLFSKMASAAQCDAKAAPANVKKLIKEGDKKATSKGYIANVSKAKESLNKLYGAKAKRFVKKYEAHVKKHKNPNCGNCKFYKDAKAKGGYAPCQMFAMAYVSGCGWCNLYKADKKKLAS